jgi:Fe-S-cluster containining protein
MPSRSNPCLTCGACCASYRASFYYREADDCTANGVPAELTEDLNQFRRVMKGTDQKSPRCIALRGEIGRRAHCGIYERRSSVCREFPASYADGVTREKRCDEARAVHGLAPLAPGHWRTHDDDPLPVAA